MANKTYYTIAPIVKRDLCTGCGTCVGVCPSSAIKIVKDDLKGIFIPQIEEKSCNYCGICYDVCPGYHINFKELNQKIFGKEPKDNLIGNYIACYIGYAKSNAIRYNSASGGLVTSLLIFALENRIIDGALVTKMNERKPLEPEVFLARTEEEISLASKSKYCPVPVNVALKEILKEGGRFAVVGLPCHIQGIRKYEIVNKELKEKIVLHLGLFCSNTPSFLATDYILTRARCKKEEIIKIDYRGQGWPGNMRIKFRDGSTLTLTDYWGTGFGQYFSPIRCIFCIDQTNELADISFGDAWLPDVIKKDKIGTSIVISRTKIGQEILEKATINNIISLNSINRDKVVQSQGNIWSFKKTNLRTRILLLRFFNKKEHPIYTSARLLEPGFNDFLKMTFRFLGRSMASKKSLWNVINSYAYLSNFLVRLLERHKRF